MDAAPNMNFLWSENPQAFGRLAADAVAEELATRPNAVIALPTGQTPLGLYAELVHRVDAGGLRLERARYFNLDDYLGLPQDHPLSYAGFLHRNLLTPARIPAAQVRLLQGDAPDSAAECAAYDQCITSRGGIDLAILGLGVNGHIAFNEPGSDWRGATRVVDLDDQTRRTHREQTGGRYPIPEQGLTMGIGTLRAARRILLLVSGQPKRRAFEALLRGVPDPAWPVTSLLGHPALRVVADAALRPALKPVS